MSSGAKTGVSFVRKTIAETWLQLDAEGFEMPRGTTGNPYIPPQMPNQSDDILGFSFFRERCFDTSFESMSLPRTYFARSQLERVSFRDSDLSESRMCWNDFLACEFTGADLSGCDMRSSVFRDCRFDSANLSRADLRRSSFEGCTFEGAILDEAISNKALARDDLIELLNQTQQGRMHWKSDLGDEPSGG